MAGKGRKKAVANIFSRLATNFPEIFAEVDASEVRRAEIMDTSLTITPGIPRVEVGISIQLRCSAPIVEGDKINIYLPGFRGKAANFTPATKMEPMNPVQHFYAYWSGDNAKKKPGYPRKQVIVLKCTRRIEAETLISLDVPRGFGIISPDKLPHNSHKIKLDATLLCTEGGKIQKQVFLSSSEVRKQAVGDEIEEYMNLISTVDHMGALDEAEAHIAEELSGEEVDQLWEAAQDRCPYPIGFQWHIGLSAFRSYEALAPLLKTIAEDAVACVKKRQTLDFYREIAQNYGVKVGAVILFQDALMTQYGSLYPNLPGPVLLAIRLLTMEPLDIARTFGNTDLPVVSMAQEIYSCFRTGNPSGLKKWSFVVSALLLVTHGALGQLGGEALINLEPPPVLYYGIKELPSEEIQYIHELKKGDWYMLPCLAMGRPNVKWTDEEAFSVPDNAVLFEIHNALDGLEICDVSMYPYDREWLLPFCSSYRIRSVNVYDDRNGLTHVVMEMCGSLHGKRKDILIPEEDRNVASIVARKFCTSAERFGYRARCVAEHTLLTVQLRERQRLHPPSLLRARYVDHYFDVQRASRAKTTIEDGTVNWQVCLCPAQMIDPVEGVIKAAVWESMPRKFALLAEQYFLARSRNKKLFEVGGIVLDFAGYLCDYSGKGPRAMRRILRRRVSHTAPLPVYEELL